MIRRPHSRFALSLPALVLVVAAGCGYSLVGRSSNLPEDVRSIFVETLENQTTRAQIDQILTQAITNEFVTRQRFTVVPDQTSADAILSGTLTSFRVRPVTFNADGRAEEYEISIMARMEFKRPGDDEPIWANPAYLFRQAYDLELEAGGFLDTEDAAMFEVAENFAQTMVIDLLEGF